MDKKHNKYMPQFSVGNVGQYSYFHEEDDNQFTLVDQSRSVRPAYQKSKMRVVSNTNKIKSYNTKLPQLGASSQQSKMAKQQVKGATTVVKNVKKTKAYTRPDAMRNVNFLLFFIEILLKISLSET